ncbi:MAG: AMIN-like domain-containing (lipo)protein [Solirubrobacteraceae bacterium]
MGSRSVFGGIAVAVLAGAAGSAVAVGGSRVASHAASAMTVPQLVGVTAAHHPGYDRIVFRFSGAVPARRNIRYVTGLIADPSGRRIPIAGRAILQVSLWPASARTATGASGAPDRIAFALPNVMTAVRSGDFESVVSYGIGLAARESFHAFTLANPSRVGVDVAVPFRTTLKRVYFLNRAHFSVGKEPYFTSGLRPVPVSTPATGLMDRLFAGPTPSETSRNLAFLSSRATGFTALSISGGVARMRLTGGCSSGGSTVSIADEIGPMLKQLPAVRYVKIFDPAGHTEDPTGRIDSRPHCLEP